jgi:hypothetical protein
MEWDNSVNKYHCVFNLIEDPSVNYSLKLMFLPTDVEKLVNSSQELFVDLIPEALSKICLFNEREVIFNEDYSFTLKTKFDVKLEEQLRLNGYVLDSKTYYRTREIINYKATDPIGEYTISEYEIDLHGLVGNSEFIDRNNFKLEFIDKEFNNLIQN